MKQNYFLKLLIFLCLSLVLSSCWAQTAIFSPGMTITPFGSVNSPGGEDFTKIIDQNVSTKFLDFNIGDGMGFTVYMGGNSYMANTLEMSTANDAAGRDPQNFQVLGSNDGTNFTSVTNGSIPCVSTRFFKRSFSFTNTTSFKYYRINYTNSCGDGILQVAETQLLGSLTNTPPTAVCKAFTAQLDASGNVTISASDVDDNSYDDKVGYSLSIDKDTFDCSNIGAPVTVKLTVTDSDGATDTCEATVTVEDNEVPEVVCQVVTIQLDDNGMASLDSLGYLPRAVDYNIDQTGIFNPIDIAADAVNVTLVDDGRSEQLPVGFTFNYYGIEYSNFFIGANGYVTFNNEVTPFFGGNTMPNGVIPNNLIALAWTDLNPETGGIIRYKTVGTAPNRILVVEFSNLKHYLDSDPVTVQAQIYEGSNVIEIHTTTIPFNGNFASKTCTQGVENVNGTLAQTVPGRNNSNWSVTNDFVSFTPFVTVGVNPNDNCGVARVVLSQSDFTCADIGTNTVIVTVTDVNGNSSSCTSTVIVEDNGKPSITCIADDSRDSDLGTCDYTVQGTEFDATFTDNCSNTTIINDFNGLNTLVGETLPKGETIIIWTVDDGNGQTATCTTVITVEDNEAPVITCPADIAQDNDPGICGAKVTVPQPVVNDNCSISGSTSLAFDGTDGFVNGPNDVVPVTGEYTISVWAKEANAYPGQFKEIFSQGPNLYLGYSDEGFIRVGNDWSTGVAFPTDNQWHHYTIVRKTNDTQLYIDGSLIASKGSAIPSPGVYLDYPHNFVVGSQFNGPSEVFDGQIDEIQIWNTSLNEAQITSNMSQTLLGTETNLVAYYNFEDGTGSSTLTDVVSSSNNGTLTNMDVNAAWVASPNPISSVNLTNNFTNNSSATATYPVGETMVIWTATDAAGNTSTCSQTVTVTDTELPTVLTQDISVQLDANGEVTITAAQINNGSKDNCTADADLVLSLDRITFSCSDVGGSGSSSSSVEITAIGSETQATNSFGGGYNPNTNEFLYPTWSGTEVNTYDAAHQSTGSFNSPVNTIIQIWMDKSSEDYYTANWSNYTVNRINGSSVVWSYNLGTTAAGITTDADYAYAMAWSSNTITVLNKETGTFVKNIVLPGQFYTYGGLIYANGLFYIAGFDGSNISPYPGTFNAIHTFNAETGAYLGSVSTGVAAYNTSFDGETMWVSPNSNTIYGYKISEGSAYDAGGSNKVILTVTDGSGNVSTTDAYVTVEDNVAAEAIAKDITVQLDETGNVEITAADVDNGSNDACGIESMSVSPSAFTCAEVGENAVTLTVTDVNGNESTTTSTVSVEDKVAAIAIAKDITVQLDETGNVSITAADVDNGSSDACGIESMSISPSAFTCAEVGENTVTLTVVDNNGNESTTTSMVTVEDNVAAVAVAKDITVQLDETGNVSITATDVDNGSDDACGIASMSVSPERFTCAEVGENTVTLTVIDNNGKESATTSTVTVEDKVAAIALAKDITVQLEETGNVSITAADVDNGSNDACGIASISVSPSAFTCAEVGANTVTLTVIDNNGNESTTTSTVSVEDNVAPVATAKNITVQLDATGNVSITAADVDNGSNDACGIKSMSISPNEFTCAEVGANTVTLTVVDNNGNESTATAIVTVKDSIKPIPSATTLPEITAECEVLEADVAVPTATDNCAGVVSVSHDVSFPITVQGLTVITWSFEDAHGNIAKQTQDVMLEDVTAPVPDLSELEGIVVECEASSIAAPTATDNCAGVVTGTTMDPTSYSEEGEFMILWEFNDGNGNVATQEQWVTVKDNTAPEINTQDLTITVDQDEPAVITPEEVNDGSSDNCSEIVFSLDKDTFGKPGVYEVVLTGTDASGNTSQSTATITVKREGADPMEVHVVPTMLTRTSIAKVILPFRGRIMEVQVIEVETNNYKVFDGNKKNVMEIDVAPMKGTLLVKILDNEGNVHLTKLIAL